MTIEEIKNPTLRIFIVGANGFIGSYITARLIKEGHDIICAVRDAESTRLKFPSVKTIHFDFNDINIRSLKDDLDDIDVVINVAGLLQSSGKNQIDNVHFNGPKVLFNECIKSGVRRIIHVSALGIDSENTTEYALSKKLVDNYLKTLDNIDWVILQPSLVYANGCYGGTSLFRALSALPYFIPLVGDGLQKFQPIHMDDLTSIISFCVNRKEKIQRLIKVVGPEIVSVKEILISFRRWLGLRSAKLIKIPLNLIKISAKVGDLFGSNILNTTLYKMMLIPNTADKEDMIRFTNIVPRSFEKGLDSEPLTIQSLWHARLYLLKPALKIILSLFWIASGVIAGILAPKSALESIKDLGLNSIVASIILYLSCFIDIALGVLLIFSKKISKICLLQIAMILSYTLVLTIFKSELWLEPLGSLIKNIPIILLTLVLMAIEKEK